MISTDIRNKILSGVYPVNSRLPFERDLCEMYQASKMTVKKALDILVADGLIIKRRGSGTYVKDLSQDALNRISIGKQFLGTMANYADQKVTSKILHFEVIMPPKEVADKLNISEDSFVYDIARIRYVNNHALAVEQMYMPLDLIVGLKRKHLQNSIYRYIEENLNLKIQSAHRHITVRKTTSQEAEYLELMVDDPVAVVNQVAFLDTGSAFEYSTTLHRYDQFSVEMILTRN